MKTVKQCKHGSVAMWCTKCRYGNTGKHDLSPDNENPRDLIDDLNSSIGRKLRDYKDSQEGMGE